MSHRYVTSYLDPYGSKIVAFSLDYHVRPEGYQVIEVVDLMAGEESSDPRVVWLTLINEFST